MQIKLKVWDKQKREYVNNSVLIHPDGDFITPDYDWGWSYNEKSNKRFELHEVTIDELVITRRKE